MQSRFLDRVSLALQASYLPEDLTLRFDSNLPSDRLADASSRTYSNREGFVLIQKDLILCVGERVRIGSQARLIKMAPYLVIKHLQIHSIASYFLHFL